jgi:hypothetical protein
MSAEEKVFCDPGTRPPEDEMKGKSVLDYARQPIDEEATLLGNRYLCRGGGMFIVAPSGQGKSTLGVQLAAEWALGWSPIGLSAREQPLRTLIVQGEDDAGDVTEMSRWILKNGLFSKAQLEQIDFNTHIEPLNEATGFNFIKKLDSYCDQFGPDIVIINPYTSYLGGDVKDEKLANQFLREWLTPLLTHHGCGGIVMHHCPKTQYSKTDDFTSVDWMYRGAGCATMTNWSRAYLVFEPVPDHEPIFRFVAAKRGQRIGWESFARYFKHSNNGELRWIPVSTEESKELEQEKKAKGNRAVVVNKEKVLLCIPQDNKAPERFDVVADKVSKELGIGINRAKSELNLLEAKDEISYSYLYVQKPDGKRGRPSRYVSRPTVIEEVEEDKKASK